MTTDTKVWLAIGFAGQAIFTARFLAQWIASERKKRLGGPGRVLVAEPLRRHDLLCYAVHKRGPRHHRRPVAWASSSTSAT